MRPAISKIAAADTVFRDVVVYFLCLREMGHALGLAHSDRRDEIMADESNRDTLADFTRLRALVRSRPDIRTRRWLSSNDIARVR